MIPQLLLIASATLASEDLTCIATGVLIAQGRLGFLSGTLACLFGIFVGDILLFLIGRIVGRPALGWRVLRDYVSDESVRKASSWLSERGMAVIFLSRFTPGLRLPTYFAAGLLPTHFWSFTGYFLVASAVWTPLLVGSTALFGDEVMRRTLARGRENAVAFGVVLGVAILALRLLRALMTFSGRRRLVGFMKRKVRWEFWPPWVAYLPLIPYFVYLSIRHRSLTLFTAANPGIPTGGFLGESKSDILANLSRAGGAVAEYSLICGDLEPRARYRAARQFMKTHGLTFPVVLKPDVGERGAGVAVIRSQQEMQAYMALATGETIIQEYVGGAEFGIFYYRFPNESKGQILSITEKRFPTVDGDGESTLEELILRDPRAVCMTAAYMRQSRCPMDYVPAAGESVRLVELGSHCRGAVFLDAGACRTNALEDAIDRIGQAHPGFYFGRFDIRTPSLEALQQGHSLKVIELNGVAAEPTHIYDPAVSLCEAYRVLFEQWRLAFEIGAMNRVSGAMPMRLGALLRVVLNRFLSAARMTPRATPSFAEIHR